MVSTATCTFVFTDIEGSTKLWDEKPEAMRKALAQHDALVRARLSQNGEVFKTMGDAFYAAFKSPSEALSTVSELQKELQGQSWGEIGTLRVRIALHTGEAETRDNDYFGTALNRVSRLLSSGHGGQILLSQATYELVRDSLPLGADTRFLGEHRLRDLERPESIYQLLAPGLPTDFPPLRSLSELPNNLPLQVTSFVGREKELTDVEKLIRKNRLVTFTGSGGTGKTRLSMQAAAELLPDFEDGVWLVELAPLTEPDLVPQTVAGALKVREEPGRPLLETLVSHLKDKKLLLILDNCEHLLDAAARLADAIGRQCPNVHLIATSREPLAIQGEQVYRVPSLSTPDPKKKETVEALNQYEAVRLFIDRALLAQTSFAVTNENAPAVAQICHRLDGIPLALELAAARVRAMPVETIASRLDDRFRLLTGGSRTALPRQQTLRATIDWSYGLLDEKEKTLLRRLSVFAGGWTLEAAEKVCADDA
jgi:class 3 adenylate cyclase